MYDVIENYRDDKKYRNQLFDLIDVVFPKYDFRKWYETGYWFNEYVPFSIEQNGKIVSNVSISKMKVYLNGNLINAIQFGTVATHPDYRKRNLSRYLMEYVIDKYEDSTDLMFLFANDSVTEFYPKFGFERKHESVFKLTDNLPKPTYGARKLRIDNSNDNALITNFIENRCITTKLFGAVDFGFITMWHLLNIFPHDIYYLEDDNAIFVITEENNELHIWDYIAPFVNDFNALLPKIIENENLKAVHFYFSPDALAYPFDETYKTDDSPFFVRGEFLEDGIKFKFPATAQT